MATRNADLRVTIDANAAKLERELERTRRSMMRFESQLRSVDAQAAQLDNIMNEQRARALEQLGRGMVVFGAATLAGLGLATKAAMDWETAWTGVLKTVDGTPEQLARVEQGLRDLASELPSSHREIAAVAEAAGQLGIATDDVVDFTRVMVDLGETTNLTAEEAATAIAQMMNVMQTAPEDVGRLGAALVELGNNGASTERDIIQMAQRISGAGAIINLSEADVLALSNALASVGIDAEAGGTAISTAMIKMADAVASGGESVQGFADVAGMSAEQFVQAFEQDPARAIQAFVEGLARIDAAGGNVFATLGDLELGNIRTRDALLRLAGAGDLLGQSLDDGARAWEENTALIEEAAKRYDTTEAKIQIAKNALTDLAIDIGGVILPAVAALAEGVAGMAEFFSNLPGPVKVAATILGGLVGTVSLLAGGFLLLAPRIAAARALLLQFGAAHKVAFGGMLYAGQFASVLAFVGALAIGLEAAHAATLRTATGVGEMTNALLQLQRGQLHEAIARLVEEQEKLADRNLAETFLRFLPPMSKARKETEEFRAEVEAVDNSLVSMVQSGNADAAADSVRLLGEQMGLSGAELRRWVESHLPGYIEALQAVEAEHQLTAESVDPVQDAMADLALRFGLTGEDAEKAAQQMLDAWTEAGGKFVDALGAYDTALEDKEAKERETAQATADATEDATDSWEDYADDVTLTVDEYIAELERMVENQENWRANLVNLAGRVSDEMLDYLVQLGPEGADLVALWASMTDEQLQKAEPLWLNSTEDAVRGGIVDPLVEAGPVLQQIAREHGEDVAKNVREYMIKNKASVYEAADALNVQIKRGIKPGQNRDIPVKLQNKAAVLRGIGDIRGAINALKDKTITVTANGRVMIGNTSARGRVASGGEIRGPGGPTDDRAGLFALSDREWVIRAAAARRYGNRAMAAINAGLAEVLLPGEGGPVSRINVKARDNIDATDFNRMANRITLSAGRSVMSSSGKVLPPGSYRVGRGPAAHGYNARDLPAPIGTPVYAAAAGVVSRAARLATSYGIHAAIQHANWRSLYAHMSQMYVRAGQQVGRGQMIGRVGSTGNSTGPHLHLEPDLPRLYDRGGKWASGTLGLNTSGGTEYVLSPEQSRMFDRMVSAMEGARGGDGAVSLHLSGDGAAFEQFAYGVRTGKLRLTANGTPVRVA